MPVEKFVYDFVKEADYQERQLDRTNPDATMEALKSLHR